MAILTVTGWTKTAPTLAEAAKELGLSLQELDRTYPPVLIDHADGTYVVRSFEDSVDHKSGYADPKIRPFAPVRRDMDE